VEQTLRFENPADGARGLRVFFVVSRTTVKWWELRGLPEVNSIRVARSRHGMDMRWNTPLPRGGYVDLILGFRGEPREVAKVVWFDGEGAVPAPDAQPHLLSAFQTAGDFTMDPNHRARAMFMARGAIIQAHPDPVFRDTAGFFYDLDVNTNGALLSRAPITAGEMQLRRGRITSMEILLERRVKGRRAWAAVGKPGPAEGLGPGRPEAVAHISGVMLSLYRKHLSRDSKLDTDLIWDVFGKFANGELRIKGAGEKDWNSEPNGAMVFCFAEFAFMAIDAIEKLKTPDAEHRASLADWKVILPSHVAIQQIYMRTYRPPSGSLTWKAYQTDNYETNTPVDQPFKDALRADLSGRSVDDLKVIAGQNALEAFRHE
jgi:hypothetical protein